MNNKQSQKDKNKQTVTDQEQISNDNVLQTSKDNFEIKKSKTGHLISSCNICRSRQSTQVNTGNLVSTNDFAENASKTPGNSTKIDLENKALPLSTNSDVDDTTKSPSAQGRIRAGKAPPRSSTTESTFMQQNAAVEKFTTGLENSKPKQTKIKKESFNTEEDIQLVYKNQIASLSTAVPETSSMTVPTLRSQPTVEEESDLLENAEQERRRNKERVRAKNNFEKKHLSPVKVMDKLDNAYLNAQREIDKILEPQSSKLKGLHRDTLINETDNVEMRNKYNEVNKGGNKDSLENARLNIHKLLDEAFDVLSQRKTILINKQQPSREMNNEANSFGSQKNHFTRTEQTVQTDESMLSHKVHTPIQVHHSFASNDPKGLITWNPYRAYDDTKFLSLNNRETNMSATPVQQEHLKTSNVDHPFRLQSKYYVTEPGEPIVIRTRNLHDVIPKNSAQRKISTTKHRVNENLSSHTKSRNLDALQNPVFNSSVPDKTVDMYPNHFYELGCFQETPTASQLIKAATSSSTQPDSSSSPYQDSSGTISANKLYTEGHSEPRKIIDKNYDVVDVIKTSLQPGISPQPLIDSLRKELQILSSKAQAASKKSN